MTNRFVPLPRIAALSVVITLFAATLAAAQSSNAALTQAPVSPSPSLAPQAPFLGTPAFAHQVEGKQAWLTTVDGTRIHGRIVDQSATGLTVDSSTPWNVTARTTVPFAQIEKIEVVRENHSVRNGILIGIAGFGGAAILQGLAFGCGDESDCQYVMAVSVITGAAAGVAGGFMTRGNRNPQLIYEAKRRTSTMALMPILSRTRKGVAFSMTWR
jgi:hypothetical protein